MAFATEAELEDYLGGTDVPTGQATLLLDLATGAIREWTDQRISPTQQRVETFHNAPRRWALPLPHPPAVAVTVDQVVDDGTTLDAADYRLEPTNELVKVNADGDLRTWSGTVEVTYTHGFDQPPDAVKAATLAMASRGIANPHGTQSIKVGDYSETFATGQGGTSGVALTEADRDQVRRYRHTGAG